MKNVLVSCLHHRTHGQCWIWMCLLFCAMQPLCPFSMASQAGREFNEADKELNVAYQAVLASISNPQHQLKFIASQKAWIKYRDEDVAFYAEHYPDSKGGLFHKLDLTKERTAFLKQLLSNPPE